MAEIYKNERPRWCPHKDACNFKKQAVDLLCCGELPEPIEHDGDFNTHRFCINNTEDNHGIFDLQINKSDVGWFFYVLEPANDIKKTLRKEVLREAAEILFHASVQDEHEARVKLLLEDLGRKILGLKNKDE